MLIDIWPTLSLGALAAQAARISFLPDAPQVMLSDTNNINTVELDAASADEWDCDIRSWVRAPDLAPGHVHPAEARLAMNGSSCGEIVRWEVGLRFRERAIIKLRSKTVDDFPTKPKPAPYHFNRSMGHDYNDIFSVDGGWTYPDQGYQAQMAEYVSQSINTETQMEYYHLLHLANGTVLDSPAGRSGFLPRPYPIAPSASRASEEGVATSLAAQIKLDSPRIVANETDDDDSQWMRPGRAVPLCDKGNLAEFHLEVNSDAKTGVQGRNVTLDFSLTRTGNGTEYPTFLDLRYVVERNLTWAYNFVHTEEEYADLVMPYRTSRRMSRPPPLPVGSMLKAPSLKELERRRDRDAEHSMGIWYSSGGRYPLNNGDVRYDFEEKDDLDKGQYTFQLEIPIAEDALPTFTSTFESFLSTFRVSLHTFFLCENSTSDFAVEEVSADEPQYTERDAEWSEFRLPPKTDEPKSRKSQRQGRSLNHDGSIPFAVRLMSEEAVVDMPVHYLEPQALAPILSLDSKLVSDYPRVGSNLREEDPTQLKKSRYADGIRGLSRSRTMRNQGGLWMHAARLWQAAENKGQKDV
ncbi:hypothetical protein I314_05086 [Cryptococcus bacillisporus CA1873]|uniref:Uncharacterized protein n=1 Tax=Cryptococcus bacillisporus CA1873 TaxID=1296111 RepID=A0ABR5B692_CRYGA|nr:hypothetical protein I314_05086 [Cryptococcus bacillisporus CA1873]|eukprot:KIR59102.1 hypothetical protein I314_05086 [Cryptococcus gattii CA1873]